MMGEHTIKTTMVTITFGFTGSVVQEDLVDHARTFLAEEHREGARMEAFNVTSKPTHHIIDVSFFVVWK